MSGLVGAVVEAWDELRIHKMRVLLALIGVAVAVMAITAVTAAVDMLDQAFREQSDRQSGRQVTITVMAWPLTEVTSAPEELDAEYARVRERYSITWASRDQATIVPVRFASGTQAVDVRAVDPPFGPMTRLQPTTGRWFTAADTATYAPVLVVNDAFLAELGTPDVATHPTVLIGDGPAVRAAVVGVVADAWSGAPPQAYMLVDQLRRWYEPDGAYGSPAASLLLWVPSAAADELRERVRADVAAVLPGWQVDAFDNRVPGGGITDGATRWVGLGIGGFALLLGGLGLVNITLVTVRYRIREIGVRRSFGATSGRIFVGVLLESVVATMVAGFVGVVAAVALIRNLPVEQVLGSTLQDMPPFPVSAALTGMACATAVGALAGVIPATVAVRVKVIDAIRY